MVEYTLPCVMCEYTLAEEEEALMLYVTYWTQSDESCLKRFIYPISNIKAGKGLNSI